jgi:cysteine-rich repeat protein
MTMNRLFSLAAGAILVGGMVLVLAECSGTRCGNGVKEGSEQCDHGAMNGTQGDGCSAECKVVSIPIAKLELDLSFLDMEGPGYTGASPNDLGVDHIHVVVSGPMAIDETWQMGMVSNQWVGIPEGDYKATVTLLDKDGNALTNDVSTSSISVNAPMLFKLALNFHQSDFKKQDYKGPLYVSPNWGAMDQSCTDASPAVEMESIQVLKMDNTPVTGMTLVGNPGDPEHNLDGTYGACFYKMGLNLFEKVPDLAWGHYQVILRGKAAGGVVAYCKKFDDLFVGPAVQNPTYELVVPAANADMGACP